MTVILRTDKRPFLDDPSQISLKCPPLSDLVSIRTYFEASSSPIGAVWHTGCLNFGCEGLRVLGTRQMTGWGLEITEIGRTGIFNPRKFYQYH